MPTPGPTTPARHDVALIGAGPIGIELAAAFRRARVDYVHLEAGCIGSTMAWWAPGTRFFSSPERIAIAGVPLVVPGQEKATREQYLDYLRGVVEQFDLPIRQYERVTGIARNADGFELTTARSPHGVGGPDEPHLSVSALRPLAQLRVRRLVLAIGNMHRPRRLDVPGEDLPHVTHHLDDPHVYARRRVLIVGGRNSAVEAAIRLYRVGARVTLSYRREHLVEDRIKYWLLPELQWLIKTGRIDWQPGTCIERIEPDTVTLSAAGNRRPPSRTEVDAVLLLTGYRQSPDLLDMLGIDRRGSDARPVLNDQTLETSVPGVYMAGTAVGGSQSRVTVFIENAHEHVAKIAEAITGSPTTLPEPASPVAWDGMEES